MMDKDTQEVVRALVVHHKALAENDGAAGCGVTERVERALDEADNSKLGTFKLTGLSVDTEHTAPGIYLVPLGADYAYMNKVINLLRSGRAVTIHIEEGVR